MFLTGGLVFLVRNWQDKVTRALGVTALIGSLYAGVVFYISIVDVVAVPDTRQNMLAAWDAIHILVILSLLWLGWEMIKSD